MKVAPQRRPSETQAHAKGITATVTRTIRSTTMTATYTFDVFSTLDGYGSYGEDGDWGGYWGKQGPELLGRRFAVLNEEQRMILGANTFREWLQLLGPVEDSELDPVNSRMRSMPTTVV